MTHVESFSKDYWIHCAVGRYRHVCGARVSRVGDKWTAIWVDGSRHEGYRTAKDAACFAALSDPLFWGLEKVTSRGLFPMGGVSIDEGRVDGKEAFIAYTFDMKSVLPFVATCFRNFVFGSANCAKCAQPMQKMLFRPKMYSKTRKNVWVAACDCGSPVWLQQSPAIYVRLREAKNLWDRQQRVKDADGRYSKADIKRLFEEQRGRCCYCNKKFCASRPFTVDHITSLKDGGSHWPSNLLLACRKCNSIKGDMNVAKFLRLMKAGERAYDLVIAKKETEIERQEKYAAKKGNAV